jgi:hypothetical protein
MRTNPGPSRPLVRRKAQATVHAKPTALLLRCLVVPTRVLRFHRFQTSLFRSWQSGFYNIGFSQPLGVGVGLLGENAGSAHLKPPSKTNRSIGAHGLHGGRGGMRLINPRSGGRMLCVDIPAPPFPWQGHGILYVSVTGRKCGTLSLL